MEIHEIHNEVGNLLNSIELADIRNREEHGANCSVSTIAIGEIRQLMELLLKKELDEGAAYEQQIASTKGIMNVTRRSLGLDPIISDFSSSLNNNQAILHNWALDIVELKISGRFDETYIQALINAGPHFAGEVRLIADEIYLKRAYQFSVGSKVLVSISRLYEELENQLATVIEVISRTPKQMFKVKFDDERLQTRYGWNSWDIKYLKEVPR